MKTKTSKFLGMISCFLTIAGAVLFALAIGPKQEMALAVDSTGDKPTLRVLNSDEQKLCSDDEKAKEYYIIYNAKQMRWFRDKVNGGATAINCFVKEDLDMTEGSTSTTTKEINSVSVICANWDPIGKNNSYSGIFNGGNKIISNWITTDSGFFTYSKGIIKNFNVHRCMATSSGDNVTLGVICRYVDSGKISNCTTSTISSVTSSNSSITAGGIVGETSSSAIVENCINRASVSAGDTYSLGGIVGTCRGEIIGCKNEANITCSSGSAGGVVGVIWNSDNSCAKCCRCVNVATVIGSDVGGIAGMISTYPNGTSAGVIISACQNTGNIGNTSATNAGGCIGDLTAEYARVDVEMLSNVGSVKSSGADEYTRAGGIIGYAYISASASTSNGDQLTLKSSYNIGSASGGQNNGKYGQLIGEIGGGKVNYKNCYYLSGGISPTGNVDNSNGASLTDNSVKKATSAFQSGEVCYLLNESRTSGTESNPLGWYQCIDGVCGQRDLYPRIESSRGIVYHSRRSCADTSTYYTNYKVTSTAHNFNSNGFCQNCGGYQKPSGDGTKASPYKISNGGQLYWFTCVVNNYRIEKCDGSPNENDSSYATIISDINLSSGNPDVTIVNINGTDTTCGKWIPIGIYTGSSASNRSYKGTFDGGNHTISNWTAVDSDQNARGLIGYTESPCDIKNITVDKCLVNGDKYCGIVCGALNQTNVANCKTTENCELNCTGTCVGGIAGFWCMTGTGSCVVKDCENNATITTSSYGGDNVYTGASGVGQAAGILGIVLNTTAGTGTFTCENCHNHGDISASQYTAGCLATIKRTSGSTTIKYCSNSGSIKGKNGRERWVGGVASESLVAEGGSIDFEQCWNTGTVSISGRQAGGLVSRMGNSGQKGTYKIKDCYNSGSVTAGGAEAGGIASVGNISTIENCYNSGKISSSSGAGQLFGIVDADGNFTHSNCYYLSGNGNPVGSGPNTGTATVKTASVFKSGAVCYLLNGKKGSETLAWHQSLDNSFTPHDNYPVLESSHGMVYAKINCGDENTVLGYSNSLIVENHPGTFNNGFCSKCGKYYQKPSGNGTSSSPYQISNGGQLYWFACVVNGSGEDLARCEGSPSKNVAAHGKLTADINLATNNASVATVDINGTNVTCANWTPIGKKDSNYTGTFNGSSKTISNWCVGSSDYSGLFRWLGDGATVQNVNVNNCAIYNSNNYNPSSCGLICGECSSSNVTIENCEAGKNTYVGCYCKSGGIVGYLCGSGNKISNCKFRGIICSSADSGIVCMCGGIAGKTSADIENCENHGWVRTDTSTNIKALGGIVGYISAVGRSDLPTVTSCVNGTEGKTGSRGNEFGDGTLWGHRGMGGIVGSGMANVHKCKNFGFIGGEHTTVGGIYGDLACYADGSDWGDNWNGGMPDSSVSVSECLNYGTVINKGPNVGGIFGFVGVTTNISNCGNVGNLPKSLSVGSPSGGGSLGGGIVGHIAKDVSANINIKNCYNIGKIEVTTNGQFVGSIEDGAVVIYDKCYYLSGNGDITGSGTVTSTNTVAKSDAAFKSGEVCYLLNNGRMSSNEDNPLIWYQSVDNSITPHDSYPVFGSGRGIVYAKINCGDESIKYSNDSTAENHSSFSNGFCSKCGKYYQKPSGDGTSSSPYQISNGGQLYWFACVVNGGEEDIAKCQGFPAKNIAAHGKLTTDINLATSNPSVSAVNINGTSATCANWTPIGKEYSNYTGTFNGNGKIISNWYIGSSNGVGLFRWLGNGATIKNVEVDVCTIYNNNNFNPSSCGFICGESSSSNITIDNCVARSDTYIGCYCKCGGIVGYLCGSNNKISNCTFKGVICSSSDSTTGVCMCGGIAGKTSADIENCENHGWVRTNTSTNIKGLGGIVGYICTTGRSDASPIPTVTSCINGTEGKTGSCGNVSGDGTLWGYRCIGGIVGSGMANVHKCKNFGFIGGEATSIGGIYGDLDCYTSANDWDGGKSDGNVSISECLNYGTVISNKDNVGGIFGYLGVGSTISNCGNIGNLPKSLSTGKPVGGGALGGGIIGFLEKSKTVTVNVNVAMENCYNIGKIEVTTNGQFTGKIGTGPVLTYNNCYYLSGNGGITGSGTATSSNTVAKSDAAFKSGEVCYLLNNGKTEGTESDPLIWYQSVDNSITPHDSYPVFDSDRGIIYTTTQCGNESKITGYSNKVGYTTDHPGTFNNGFCTKCKKYYQKPSSGDGTSKSPYKINNGGQLYWFACVVNGSEEDLVKCQNSPSKNAAAYGNLTADINLANGNGETTTAKINGSNVTCGVWMPIGDKDLYSSDYSGTFNGNSHTVSNWAVQDKAFSGLFGSAGIIKNVNVDKCCVNCTTDSESNWNCGLICSVQSTTGSQISNCKTLSDSFISVKNGTSVGGIVGVSNAVSTIENCENNAAVSGETHVGGIVGCAVSNVNNCINNASISGKNHVGGIIGKLGSLGSIVEVSGCENNKNISSSGSYVGGICGSVFGPSSSVKIDLCKNSGEISGISSCTCAGGCFGYLEADSSGGDINISNCKNTGNINVDNEGGGIIGKMIAIGGTTISLSKSYNIGNVTVNNASSDAAGICSIMGDGYRGASGTHKIIDCYNAGSVSGKRCLSGVVSYSYQQSNGENIIENCHSFSSISGGTSMCGILGVGYLGTTKVKNCYYNCAGSSIPAVGTSNENATVETEKVESKTEADFSNWVVRDLLDQGRNVWAQGTTYPIFVDAAEGEITLSWDKLNYKYNFGKWDVSSHKYDSIVGWLTPFPNLRAESSSTNAKFRIYVTFTPNEDSMSPVGEKYFGIFDADKLSGSPLDYIELAAAKSGSVQSKIVALKLLGILKRSAGKNFVQDSSNNKLGMFNIKVTY